MRRREFLTAVVLGAASLALAGCGKDETKRDIVETAPLGPDDEVTYEFKVPFGTGNRLDSGETLDIMPQTLDVRVGESIRIVNDDIRDYMIGPFFVTAGQMVAMRFTHIGVLTGICLVNPGGEFTINVTE